MQGSPSFLSYGPENPHYSLRYFSGAPSVLPLHVSGNTLKFWSKIIYWSGKILDAFILMKLSYIYT